MRQRWWRWSEERRRAVNERASIMRRFIPYLTGILSGKDLKPSKEGLETFLERFGIFSRKVWERVSDSWLDESRLVGR